MGIEESVDCDGTCSNLDTIGTRLTYGKIDEGIDETIARLPSERHTRIMNYLQRTHSTIYRVLYNLGF